MIQDHDPGDEHRDPWPFTCGAVFEVRSDDGAVVAFYQRAPAPRWHTVTAGIERAPLRGHALVVRETEE